MNDNLTTEINIGIGNLIIQDSEDEIKYKFIPNISFEKAILKTLIEKKNPLKIKLEQALVNKITKTYKNIL